MVDNASTDGTGAIARRVPGVRVADEPAKGLVVARETGRRVAQGDILAYVDADWTGRFDVIAITDHILMKRDLLGRQHFSVTEDRFEAYLEDIAKEAERARRLYGLLVIPGAEITQNRLQSKKNSHIIALNIR